MGHAEQMLLYFENLGSAAAATGGIDEDEEGEIEMKTKTLDMRELGNEKEDENDI